VEKHEASQKYRKASQLYEREHFADALAIFDELDKALPDNGEIMYARAPAMIQLGRHDEARAIGERLNGHFNDPRGSDILARTWADEPAPRPIEPVEDEQAPRFATARKRWSPVRFVVKLVFLAAIVATTILLLKGLGGKDDLMRDCVLLYNFDEVGEDTITDFSGGGRDAVVNGVEQALSDATGRCRKFSENTFIECRNSAELHLGTASFSVVFWMKAGAQEASVISKLRGAAIPPAKGWNIECGDTPGYGMGVRLGLSDGLLGDEGIVSTGPDALDNTWHHVAFVVDRGLRKAKAYLDGGLVETADIAYLGDVASDDSIYLGWRGDGEHYRGLLDELVLFGRVLPKPQVTRLSKPSEIPSR